MKFSELNSLKGNRVLHFSIMLAAFLFVFVSSDTNLKYQLDITLWFRDIFYTGILHERLFKFFDYLFILLTVLLIGQFGLKRTPNHRLSTLFLSITFINTILIYINPNHDAKYMFLGLPVLSDVSIYTWLLFTFVVFYLREAGFLYFIHWFGRYLLLFASGKAIILLFLWLTGSGFYFQGFFSILMEEDNLLLFALLQLLALALFFEKKQILFLISWFLLITIEVLSFRRSGTTVSLFALTLWLLYYQLKFTKATKLFVVIILGFVALFYLSEFLEILPYNAKLYIARYVGEFVTVPGVPVNLDFQYNQHLGQSEYGLAEAFEKLSFWGYGYGHDVDKAIIYYGGNSAIHNAFVSSWMFHSLFFPVYLVILLLISIYYTVKLMASVVPRDFGMVLSAVAFFLLAFYLDHWVLPLANVTELKMAIFRSILFALLFRLTPTNVKYLYDLNSGD